MTTIKDVARAANVSTATVSHVLNHTRYVSDELRARVLKAVEELDYRPSQVATSLRTKRSYSILLIIPDIANPFFPPLARGVQDTFDRAGIATIVGNTDRRRDRELEFLNLARRTHADGVIIIASEITYEDLQPLLEDGSQAVLIGTHLDHQNLDVVRVDNQAAAREAVQHLIALGHRRIAMVSGPMSASSRQRRLEGYRQAMADAGLDIHPDWVVDWSEREADFQQIRQLLSAARRPTAIFAAADVIALDLLHVLREAGLRVPDDISLVGFDDIPATRLTTPPLTTVHQPTYQMGQRAAELLLRRVEEDDIESARECTVMEHRLVVRGSTARL